MVERLTGSLHQEGEASAHFSITSESRLGPIDIIVDPETADFWLQHVNRHFYHPFKGTGYYGVTDDIVAAQIILERLGAEDGAHVEFQEKPAPWPGDAELEEGETY